MPSMCLQARHPQHPQCIPNVPSTVPLTCHQCTPDMPLVHAYKVYLFNRFYSKDLQYLFPLPLSLAVCLHVILKHATPFCTLSWDATQCPSSPCASLWDAPPPSCPSHSLSCMLPWDKLHCLLPSVHRHWMPPLWRG